ncbi:AAA family ATPase [Catenisphaera adipataccumulans]|jgi:nitrogenase iron protein NifH|uniref:nitrogenase n=1 Tax=Catenisphaera adipataccumulans TaxID=700500 RepID=A0A7W8FVX0_9FIRM|nr:nitrogenase iron protein NifH [Catenisphaera adipataccumulans]MBB5182065.1 nitrogenase iron protein NifH [Catenisphaera adipataccumulans]
MIKLAFYGKGGIGKSTTVSNVSAALAEKGYTVMQIGCDPKADSTINLRREPEKAAVLDLLREKNQETTLEEVVTRGYRDVLLVEAGGPTPGLGCAGRGIIAAMEFLDDKKAYEVYHPDVVLFDVLGDVVCGGFAMPIREGYADQVYILTSGEAMSIHAAMNIALAVEMFQKRGYATLGGVIVNRRMVNQEEERIAKLCKDIHSSVVGILDFSKTVQEADDRHQTVIEAFPDSYAANMYRRLAEELLENAHD